MRLILFSIFAIIPVFLSAQQENDPEKILNARLSAYCLALPREEIYVHTDRNEYVSGEEIWAELYLLDRKSNTLTNYRTIGYLEILNQSNAPVFRKRILIEKGAGAASLSLPDTLSTGRYTIRVYTGWMKNFLPGNCFEKEILVYNALNTSSGKIPVLYHGSTPASGRYGEKVGIFARDISLTVSHLSSGGITVSLIRNASFNIPDDGYILLIQNRGSVTCVRTDAFSSGKTSVSLSPANLSPGVNQLVLFDRALNYICSRLSYIPLKLSEEPDFIIPDSVQKRSLVTVSSSSPGFSMSVSGASSPDYFPDFEDYMVFGSEFGTITSYPFKEKLENIEPGLVDSLLDGHESNWIDWKIVMSGQLPRVIYPPERDSHILRGRLMDRISGQPFAGKNVFLSIPGKVAVFQSSKTDTEGFFKFTLPVTEDLFDVVIQPEEANSNSSVMIMSSFCDNCLSGRVNADTSLIKVPDYLSKWGINYQINKIYGISSHAEKEGGLTSFKAPVRFYGKPDIELMMDDYVKLPLMEEVFFELTPGVQLKRKKSTFSMSVSDPVSGRNYEKDPVVMIDGVVISDLTPLAALDPELVEKIDVVKDLYLVGDYIFFGIVNVITRKGNIGNISMPAYAVKLRYRPVDKSGTFRSPDYSDSVTGGSRIPDFRNTLFWAPFDNTGAPGKDRTGFWSSDVSGNYRIDINGINSQGQPCSVHRLLKVY